MIWIGATMPRSSEAITLPMRSRKLGPIRSCWFSAGMPSFSAFARRSRARLSTKSHRFSSLSIVKPAAPSCRRYVSGVSTKLVADVIAQGIG
jgi:hypothetical protein